MSALTSHTPQGTARLSDIMREVRLAEAAHFDALTDIRDAQTLRLSVLKADIAAGIADQCGAQDYFDLALVPGDPPRLWLDMVSYVIMAPNPRTFRLVQDVEHGHDTLFETVDRAEMTDKVLHFIAHRLIERERVIAGRGRAQATATGGYSNAAIVLAWLSGFALGILALLSLAVGLSRFT